MSAYCAMCGLPVPEGQRVCSMCYGDIDYGRDGYYREFMERAADQAAVEQQECEREPRPEADHEVPC